MNISEANDTQTLLGWLLDPHQVSDQDITHAREAAQRLADRSHRALHTGLTEADVAGRWPGLLQGCGGCERCGS